MKLKLSKRSGKTRSTLTQIRFRGDIPSVIYQKGVPSESVCVDGGAFQAALRGLKRGYLPTTIFQLDLNGSASQAIVKEIQYHPTTYRIIHLDFLKMTPGQKVDVKVPVVCTFQEQCVGIKLGGFLRRVIRHLKVRCLPENIPRDFRVDIRDLGVGETKRVRDIEMAETLECLTSPSEVVLVIAKR